MPDPFSDVKRISLEKRRTALEEEYAAVSSQISQTLGAADRLKLQRQAKAIEGELAEVTRELAALDKSQYAATAPHGETTSEEQAADANGHPIVLGEEESRLASLSETDKGRRGRNMQVAIIVALIGMIGTVIAAVVGSPFAAKLAERWLATPTPVVTLTMTPTSVPTPTATGLPTFSPSPTATGVSSLTQPPALTPALVSAPTPTWTSAATPSSTRAASPTSPANMKLLFSEDFEALDLTNWGFEGGTWKREVIGSRGLVLCASTVVSASAQAKLKQFDFSDTLQTVDIMVKEYGSKGRGLFQVRDGEKHDYQLEFEPQDTELWRHLGAGDTTQAEWLGRVAALAPATWYAVEMEINGPDLRVRVGDNILATPDPWGSMPSGTIRLGARDGAVICFDNLRVFAPAAPRATAAATVTPTAAPRPRVITRGDRINLRAGPGTAYPVVGSIGQGEALDIVGKNAELPTWWQVCCVASQRVWVLGSLIEAVGPLDAIPVVAAPPPPAPLPTPLPLYDWGGAKGWACWEMRFEESGASHGTSWAPENSVFKVDFSSAPGNVGQVMYRGGKPGCPELVFAESARIHAEVQMLVTGLPVNAEIFMQSTGYEPWFAGRPRISLADGTSKALAPNVWVTGLPERPIERTGQRFVTLGIEFNLGGAAPLSGEQRFFIKRVWVMP
jgi:hypothetical protein